MDRGGAKQRGSSSSLIGLIKGHKGYRISTLTADEAVARFSVYYNCFTVAYKKIAQCVTQLGNSNTRSARL